MQNMRSRSETTEVVDVEALLQAAPGLEVLAVLDGLDPFELGEADQIVLLEVFEKQQRWLAARASTAMAAAVGLAPVDGDDFVREDVRAALHLSGQTAQDRIDVARALHTTMPATLGALQEGRINYRQVTDLVSATHLLDPDVITRVETKVLDRAAGLTVGEFRRAGAKALDGAAGSLVDSAVRIGVTIGGCSFIAAPNLVSSPL